MLPEVVTRFAAFLQERERSPLSIASYTQDLTAFARWFEATNAEAFEPHTITRTDLREYKQFLVATRGLRPSTVNRQLATLRAFLHWAHDAGLLRAEQPPPTPRRVAEERLGPRWLDRREQRSLLKCVERGACARDIAIVTLLLHTGLRVRELCALRWQDIKISHRAGRLVVREGKGQKRREVPLNQSAREALLGLGYHHHAGTAQPVLMGQRGRLTPRGVQNMLRKYALQVPLHDVSPHTLRHTFCKNLVNAGASLQDVAALAGHESLETTRRYCEPSLTDLARTVDLIAMDSA